MTPTVEDYFAILYKKCIRVLLVWSPGGFTQDKVTRILQRMPLAFGPSNDMATKERTGRYEQE